MQFPSTLKYIGNQAFYGCKNLSLVIFSGDNALDVGESAFLGCTSLKDVTYNGMSLANWAKSNFATSAANPLYYAKVFYCGHLGGDLKDLSVPSGVTRIGNYAFGGCLLDNVTIPDGVTSIGEGAFSGSDADAVTIQGFSLREIGSYAFSTVNMKSFSVPPGVTTIGEKAFFGCRLLKTVSIPESVTTIGDQAFVFAPETVFVDYGDAERVRTMLEDSLLSTSGITFVEDDLSYGYVTFVIVDSSNPSDSVTFMMRKGTTIESKIFIPSRSGHEFLGWYTAKTGGAKVTATTEVTGDVTYYAQWTPKSYTITFNANGGSVTPAFKMVDYCKTYGTLPTPTWGGHEFLGWFTAKTGGTKVTASTKCVGNSTVYAQWKVKQYKLTFNANGGTVSPGYKMVDYCKTCDTFPTPTWGGHTFNGWYTARSGGTKVTAPWKCTGNKTIYAQWTVKQYKLTGWFTARTGGTKVTAPWKCTGNKTIYAQWTVKQYTITFNANGGSVSPTSQKVNYCATYTLPTPTWSGHSFKGWYTAKTGGTKVTSPAKCTGNATLYARW